MSHTYDAIYAQFKKGVQNRSEIIFLKQNVCHSFFGFRVTWLEKRFERNFSIDSDILIMNLKWLYGLLHNLWKRLVCRTQKMLFSEIDGSWSKLWT